jgi:subtilisin family serine protease
MLGARFAFLLVVLFVTTAGVGAATQFTEYSTYGPWIIEFDTSVDSSQFEPLLRNAYNTIADKSVPFSVPFQWTLALYGALVEGLTQTQLESIPGIHNVHPDEIFNATAYNWGTDRIDQTSGTDGSYNPAYSGAGVDVYVIDTGVDCDHIEFAANEYGRVCENIYNAYGATTSNTDGHSHGTHCAGTVGGNTIGVAKGANIYGMKSLSDSGSGSSSFSIEAVNMAIDRHTSKAGAMSVLSMSLGSACSTPYCANNPSLTAVQNAVTAGIVVSVAAGNDGCNACFFSPAAAPNVITVGATTQSDDQASFSNAGQCIDMWGPG